MVNFSLFFLYVVHMLCTYVCVLAQASTCGSQRLTSAHLSSVNDLPHFLTASEDRRFGKTGWPASPSMAVVYLTRTTQHLAWFSLGSRDWTHVFILAQQVFSPLSPVLCLVWDFSCLSSVCCFAYCTGTLNYLRVVVRVKLSGSLHHKSLAAFWLHSSLLPFFCYHVFNFFL